MQRKKLESGKITREERVALVHKYDTEFPSEYLNDWLTYMDISEDQFFSTIENFRSPHLWHKVKWKMGTYPQLNDKHLEQHA